MEFPFGMVSGVGPRSSVLNGRAHWRHHYTANMVEGLRAAAVTRSGDAACSQITLAILSLP